MRVFCAGRRSAINQFHTRLDGVLVGQRALALSGHARAESKAKGPSTRARGVCPNERAGRPHNNTIKRASFSRHCARCVRSHTCTKLTIFVYCCCCGRYAPTREHRKKNTHTRTHLAQTLRVRAFPLFVSAPKIDAGHDFSQRMRARAHGLKILWRTVGDMRARTRRTLLSEAKSEGKKT